ncbi:ABC transporter substrate-binding protein [Anaerocolumna sp. MB42-C2]|uniref:ABC transporter substrate-binding protein n=1 Tax=Anaerocolumna sp. MB42-C2 TaxID=3070997 RepID=UPI0027DF5FDB|nr:extracellular solute-binding protein [Anaerocolumna sp. MB42-C2]WMJ89932.1 extracellular solute-binding protein [Anaerocolumna sp. MB42-C2]
MKKMKKWFSVLLSAALVLSLVGCGGGKSETAQTGNNGGEKASGEAKSDNAKSGEKPKIVISCYPADEAGTQLRDEYYTKPIQAAFPDYDISVEVFNDRQSLQVQVAGGGGPDILDLDGLSDVVEFARADRIVALDDYASKYGWNNMFYDWAYNSSFYDKKLYSLPTGYESMVIYYNNDVFNEHGWKIPTTISEAEPLMEDMVKNDVIPFSFGNSNYVGAVDWLYSTFMSGFSGPEVLKSALEGKTPMTDESVAGGIQLMADWWQKGYIGDKASQSITGDDMIALFAQGKAAMMINGTWAASSLISSYPDCNWSCATPFEMKEGVGPVLPIASSGGYAINTNSKNPDVCAEILNYLFTDMDRMEKGVVEASYCPYPVKEFSIKQCEGKGMDERLYNIYVTMEEAMAAGNVGYCSWTFFPADARAYMNENTDALFLGSLSVEDYMTKVQEFVDAAVADGTAPTVP